MITPAQQAKLDEYRAKNGIKAPASTATTSTYDAIDALVAQKKQQATAEQEKISSERNLGERTADIFKESGQKIKESVERGAKKFAEADVEDGVPLGGVDENLKKTGAVLEAGLGAASGVSRAVFAPLEAVASKIGDITGLTKLIKEKAADSPEVHALAKWAEENPDLARNLSDAITVAGTAFADVGGAKNIMNTDVSKIPGAIADIPDDMARTATKALEFGKGTPTEIPQDIEFARKLTAPKLSTKEAEEAIASGRVTKPGILKPSKVLPSKHDDLVAESVADVVKPGPVADNVSAIEQKMSQINQGVREMLADRKTPFNMAQLRKRLMDASEESQLVFASEPTAEKTYKAVVDEFLKHVESGDTLGLFEARQAFDKVPAIKKLLDTERMGENVRRQIVLDIRRAANEYVAEQLPANNPYRAALTTESRMFEALGNIGAQNASVLGKNQIQILLQKHPTLKWVVGGVSAGLTGALLSPLNPFKGSGD